MGRFALMTGAALLAALPVTAMGTGSAQAYEWGGGTCVGYGCARPVYGDGYRTVRRYEDHDVRPGMRVYERGVYRHHDWDDDDDDLDD